MNNDLFKSCHRNTLAESYACCLHHCGPARICKALCKNIYPGTIDSDCAATVGCMLPDFYNHLCIDQNRAAYRQCCLRRCESRQWSDSPSIQRLFEDYPSIDCQEYCDAAESILLDKVHGRKGYYEN
jgi:hypothetical protein